MEKLTTGRNTVCFESDGFKLEGHLFIPEDYKEGEKRGAIVVTRPASGVKEQTAGLYAEKFAEKSYITLAFDPKGYGGSEGVPQMEDPFSIISDNKNAYKYLQSLQQVDANKIISAGICMGAGHAVAASSDDQRVKATLAISPYLTSQIDYPKAFGGRMLTKIMMGISDPIIKLFKMLGVYFYIPIVPLKKWMELIPATETQTGMKQYYGYENKPGSVPSWKNKGNFYHASYIMTGKYNPFNYIKGFINKPFFMAYADGGYSTDKIEQFYNDVPADEKFIMVCPNSTHFDLYYKPEFVKPIVDQACEFLNQNNLNP
ncbi:alpha/beta hydrolase [Marinifilum sp.]|uniref:alpha/beta hydrolase n=1 Tax=Marinifilum sp. TaxID=2033137 RepID=UPI003BAB1368